MARWTLDLKKFADGEKARVKAVRKRYVFSLYASIVKKTPVDTGRARGNWNVSVGSEDSSVSEMTKRQYMQGRSLPSANGDEPYFISNNLPYIGTLEYGGYPSPVKKGTKVSKKGEKPARYEIRSQGGFSKQAPNGMVGVTLANSEALFKNAVEFVRERGGLDE